MPSPNHGNGGILSSTLAWDITLAGDLQIFALSRLPRLRVDVVQTRVQALERDLRGLGKFTEGGRQGLNESVGGWIVLTEKHVSPTHCTRTHHPLNGRSSPPSSLTRPYMRLTELWRLALWWRLDAIQFWLSAIILH
jgi:hypothetical protein